MFNEFQKVSRFKKNEHNLLNVYIIYSSIDQLLKKRTGISESSSEKLEEKITWFSYTANINWKNCRLERNLNSHTFGNTAPPLRAIEAIDVCSELSRYARL